MNINDWIKYPTDEQKAAAMEILKDADFKCSFPSEFLAETDPKFLKKYSRSKIMVNKIYTKIAKNLESSISLKYKIINIFLNEELRIVYGAEDENGYPIGCSIGRYMVYGYTHDVPTGEEIFARIMWAHLIVYPRILNEFISKMR